MLDEKRGITLDVLFPDRDVSGLDTNDGSLVTRLSYGEICFLLMGDAPRGVEEYLTHLYGDYLHCAVLKVGHHGSRTSSSEFFVQKVAPQYAVISDGKDNSYGHPHQETLDTLKEFGVNVLRTDTLGTITFETDGVELWKRKWGARAELPSRLQITDGFVVIVVHNGLFVVENKLDSKFFSDEYPLEQDVRSGGHFLCWNLLEEKP